MYQSGLLDSIIGVALFLKLFPETPGNKLLEARKSIQVSRRIHFKHILIFIVSPGYLVLKLI